MARLILGSVFLSGLTNAQIITETFGTGANAFSIDFVTIGNPANAPDSTGYGAVNYTYNISKYEVSRDMVDKANVLGGLNITMQDLGYYGGNRANRPATGISWLEAATYVNWLNTSSGSSAAYKLVSGPLAGWLRFELWTQVDSGYNPNNPFRNTNARYWLPSADEWYKAAYGNPGGSWSDFPNRSDIPPTATSSGTLLDTAVYNQNVYQGPADINSAGGLSPFGTMAQGGNVWEMTETAFDGVNDTENENREFRGGDWASDGRALGASYRISEGISIGYDGVGFRIAMVPEPSALSLIVVGFCGSAMLRRRR